MLPALLFILFFSRTHYSTSLKIIFVTSIAAFALLFLTDYIPGKYQHYFYSLFILVEYICFALFLWLNIRNATFKKVMVLLSILFAIFIILYTIFAKIRQLDSVSIGIESILILGYSFFFLYELINSPKVLFITNDYRFWIVFGMILYLAGSFFMYIYAEQIKNIAEITKFWFLTWVFYSLKALLFSIVILIYYKQPKEIKTKAQTSMPYLDMI